MTGGRGGVQREWTGWLVFLDSQNKMVGWLNFLVLEFRISNNRVQIRDSLF